MGWLTIKRVITIANALILFWVWTLWWGERTVFQESLEGCRWGEWEKWVSCPYMCSMGWEGWKLNVLCEYSQRMLLLTMLPSSPIRN